MDPLVGAIPSLSILLVVALLSQLFIVHSIFFNSHFLSLSFFLSFSLLHDLTPFRSHPFCADVMLVASRIFLAGFPPLPRNKVRWHVGARLDSVVSCCIAIPP